MNHMSITDFRANLASAVQSVRDTHEAILVTQGNKEPVWVMPFSSADIEMDTTALILANPKWKASLDESIAQADAGLTVEVNIDELRQRALKALKEQEESVS